MTTATVNKNTAIKDRFVASFQQYRADLNGHRDHPLSKFKQAGFEEFEGMDFPTTRDEDWKYTSVQRMLRHDFQEVKATSQTVYVEEFSFPELNAIQLVFVNGIYNEELSSDLKVVPGGLMIHSMEEALENDDYRAWIDNQIAYEGGTAKNVFLPMNRAFAQSGLFIKTVKGVRIEQPIHLLHIATDSDHIAHPQLFVWAAESSELSIIETYNSTQTDNTYFNNTANQFQVEANARVHYYRFQQESEAAFKIHNTLVLQGRDSVFSSYIADLGGQMVRNNMSVELTGSNTETNMYGTYLGTGNQHIDNQTFMDHALPHCVSNELYKGILTDRARGVFNGKVLVRQDAQKTNAFQQYGSLVLSDKAIMDAKPQLEIYADDVKCSHGATIGQLDEASIFYLRTRGIPEAKAKNLLQRAFVGEAVEAMPIDAVHDRVMAAIEEKLG
jgi:Fe-S cluster assembly protein SufD